MDAGVFRADVCVDVLQKADFFFEAFSRERVLVAVQVAIGSLRL